MTNSASLKYRAEAQTSDSSRMQSEEALKQGTIKRKKKKKLHRVLHLCVALAGKDAPTQLQGHAEGDVTPAGRGDRFQLTFLLFKGLNRA